MMLMLALYYTEYTAWLVVDVEFGPQLGFHTFMGHVR